MQNSKIIDNLTSLVRLDIDAIHAYDQAIEKIEDQSICDRLADFRDDHLQHVNRLSECIERLGGTAPEFSRDFKGFLIEGMTIVRSVTGTEGALKAMKTNEKLTNFTYDKALSWDLPQDVKEIVEKNRDDERRHLNYIEQCINARAWEREQKIA